MVRNRSRRRVLAVPVLCLLLLLPGAGDAATAANRPARPVQPIARGVVPELNRLLQDLGLPDLLSLLAPGQATSTGGLPAAVANRVTASTVKVSGVACGFRVEGSGFSPAPDTVVTNAHVVAGVANPQVLRPDGRTLRGQVQLFDSGRDLAVLSVPGLSQQPLSIGPAVAGGTGAVFGHPQGQIPVEISPARIVRKVSASISDIYGENPARRDLLVVATVLEPGDSGAALVNESGTVVGVAFAVSTLRPGTAFAVPSEDLAVALAQPRTGPVSTGPCLV
jgi:S1-C subfamily serine protease